MAVRKDMYIKVQNKVQPHLKGMYSRACRVLPESLIMSRKYFEVKEYLGLEDAEDESSAPLQTAQAVLLARTLRNALQHVSYYRERVSLDPESIVPANAVESLRKFPLIDKQEISARPEDFISDKYSKRSLIYTTSGGSTGRGIVLWKSYDEYQVEQAFIEDMWTTYGWNRSSKILRIGADGILPPDKPPCHREDRRLLVSPRHLNEEWLDHIVDKAEDFGPQFIHTYPSCLEVLASHLKASGRSLEVKGIFLASEEVKLEQLEFFKDVFQAPICFFYGACEHALLGYGCCDGSRITYHLNPMYGFAENLEDEYGHELVGTGLWNEAMPLIRYRTQDYGRIVDGLTRCAVCGRTMRTVEQLDGRMQNYLTTKQGTRFPGLSIVVDKFIWDYASTFQFVQNQPGAIELHICPKGNLTPEVEQRIIEAQKKRLSGWFDPITLVKVPEIHLTKGGKRRLVVINEGEVPGTDRQVGQGHDG
ncbi:MAG: phenylacetate--CoA ligase family protein [Methanomassiliicoccus sp.]|nr:phenylacetate--CoA ligase family protein [Methanomassiliicoccus sp.]